MEVFKNKEISGYFGVDNEASGWRSIDESQPSVEL
jgi:hypothetical protein